MAGDEDNPWPRAQEAHEYLEKHKVLELFNNMTSQLMFERPENPKEFLMNKLEELSNSRTTNMDHPCLFDDSNIQAVFGMLDPTNKGIITAQQYKEALLTLGIKDFDKNPPGTDVNRITYDSFSREAKAGLVRMSSTYNK